MFILYSSYSRFILVQLYIILLNDKQTAGDMEAELRNIEASGRDPIQETYKKTVEMIGNQTAKSRKWAYRILS